VTLEEGTREETFLRKERKITPFSERENESGNVFEREKIKKSVSCFLREERDRYRKKKRNERGNLFEKVRKDKKNSYLIFDRGTGKM
jgi:hypothetical protein